MKIYLDVALIIIVAKLLGLVMRRLKLPEVIGALLAGLILGPNLIGVVEESELLSGLSSIGVVLIMFGAGLETNLKQIKAAGKPSVIITFAGVILPMGLGFLVACLFNGGFNTGRDQMLDNLYYGVILTATSVAITVATLKELGKLTDRAGTSILSAAVLDDIIGLVILTVVIGQKNPDSSIGKTLLFTALFFVFVVVCGFIINKLYKMLEKRYEHHRRMAILGVFVCLFFAYAAEAWFGLAEIVGAFMAGVVFSDTKDAKYVEKHVDESLFLLFSPIFFAHIGIAATFGSFGGNMVWLGICFVLVGLLGKLAGCSLSARACGYTSRESLRVGLGMMARAEVALITTQKGIEAGFISEDFMPFVIALVLISSLLTPILLKLTYRNDPAEQLISAPSVPSAKEQ